MSPRWYLSRCKTSARSTVGSRLSQGRRRPCSQPSAPRPWLPQCQLRRPSGDVGAPTVPCHHRGEAAPARHLQGGARGREGSMQGCEVPKARRRLKASSSTLDETILGVRICFPPPRWVRQTLTSKSMTRCFDLDYHIFVCCTILVYRICNISTF
jgi:hypothetical protein